jgi:hypothetical protein
MASIEFGILEDWSDTSLIPESIVDLDESEFEEIKPILDRIGEKSCLQFDLYSSTRITEPLLGLFIEEFSRVEVPSTETIAKKLIRAARHAQSLHKPLWYRGL